MEVDRYNKPVYFNLPGAFESFCLYEILIPEYFLHNEKFKDNVNIQAIFGAPPTSKWNGGRIIIGNPFQKNKLKYIKDFYDRWGVPVSFTFSNSELKEYHLYDEYCNEVLKLFNTGINEIICNSPILEKYIRDNYGNRYKYISSTTKRLNNEKDQSKELEKEYSRVVLDYDFNKDFTFLENIKNKDKCELLCNAVCNPKCPYRAEHYKALAKAQLTGFFPIDNTKPYLRCEMENTPFWEVKKNNKNFISNSDINKIYNSLGFKNYKIEGRMTDIYNTIEVLLYYLIKEEYKDEMRSKLQLNVK